MIMCLCILPSFSHFKAKGDEERTEGPSQKSQYLL